MESHEIKSNSEGDRIDYGIILSVMLLALIGLVSIYLATAHDTTTLQIRFAQPSCRLLGT